MHYDHKSTQSHALVCWCCNRCNPSMVVAGATHGLDLFGKERIMTTKSHDLKASIEYIQIDALIPYARNSRTHSDAQVAQIAASIKEFGFTNPVLIDGGGGSLRGMVECFPHASWK